MVMERSLPNSFFLVRTCLNMLHDNNSDCFKGVHPQQARHDPALEGQTMASPRCGRFADLVRRQFVSCVSIFRKLHDIALMVSPAESSP